MSDHSATPTTGFAFSNQMYDKLKWVAQILLPGLGTLYFALAAIWGLLYAEQVIGTISAVDVFLGLLLGLSAKGYAPSTVPTSYDGAFVVNTSDPLKDTYTLHAAIPFEDMAAKKSVTLEVQQQGTFAPPAPS